MGGYIPVQGFNAVSMNAFQVITIAQYIPHHLFIVTPFILLFIQHESQGKLNIFSSLFY